MITRIHIESLLFVAMISLSLFGCSVMAEDGIAVRYPGDEGIDQDAAVIFVESFDKPTIDEVLSRWETVQSRETLTLSSKVPRGSSDESSLLVTHVGGKGNGAFLYRRLTPGYEKLHVRFYVRFDQDCAPIHHFFHVGGYNPATAWPQGGAGQRPDGGKRFSTGVEPHGDSWTWDYYSYWMEMGGSPPRGQTWGNSFIHNPKLAVKRGEWICMELMMKLNDVGDSNGEMALWIDGELVSKIGKGFPRGKWVFDKFLPGQGGEGVRWNQETKRPDYLSFPPGGAPFEGFRWRSEERLNLNFLWVLLYITKAPQDHVSHVWFDNIVVAKDYIGPIEPNNR